MIRVLVVDDQAIVRDGLATVLQLAEGISVVGEAADGRKAVALARELRPDVVLMDLRMPVMSGTEATRALAAELPHIAVVVLTTYGDDASIAQALAAGARGYLTKDARRDQVAQAIRSAATGQVTFTPEVGRRVIRQFTPTRPTLERFPTLTEREAEILECMAAGKTNTEIAAALFLSVATVKSYINSLFSKLNTHDRGSAIALFNGD